MNDRERAELERKALRATDAELRVWTNDARREHAAVARRELTRREREEKDGGSLTGVVEPL